MVSNNMSGIEKLQECAYDMNQMQCDDVLVLAAQIEREHVSELQAFYERYETDLREAREARDIAIKEASKLRNDKRLMPPGMEWPRFEDGERVEFGSAVDGLDSPCEKFIFTRSMGGVCQLQDAGGNMVNVLHGELLRADYATHTPPDTQERIDEDVCKVADACTYFSSDGSCAKCKFVSQYGDADSAYEECPKSVELDQMAILDLLRRQRELDARTMGGE